MLHLLLFMRLLEVVGLISAALFSWTSRPSAFGSVNVSYDQLLDMLVTFHNLIMYHIICMTYFIGRLFTSGLNLRFRYGSAGQLGNALATWKCCCSFGFGWPQKCSLCVLKWTFIAPLHALEDASFSVSGPSTWNNFPWDLRVDLTLISAYIFYRHLKAVNFCGVGLGVPLSWYSGEALYKCSEYIKSNNEYICLLSAFDIH